MKGFYELEIVAIGKLRELYPLEGQRTLARKIVNRDFPDGDARKLAGQISGRPFYSVYAAIRRYDAKRLELAAA